MTPHDLDQALPGMDDDLAETIEASRRFQARHVRIPEFAYPDDVRLAVNFTVDFDAQLNRRLKNEPIMELTQGEFGGRVGIWRLLDLFDRHGIKATIFTVGRICELYPEALKDAVRRGHEVANHMWEHRVPVEAELERDHLEKATVAVETLCGTRPVGTRSDHRLASLTRAGYIYTSSLHGGIDDVPYYVMDERGEHPLLNLPFHYALDDAMYFHFSWYGSGNAGQRLADPAKVLEIWMAAFRQLYRRGRYLNIVLHGFVSGRALRIAMLDRLIVEMKQHPGVWFPTCEEVARHCWREYPLPRSAGTPHGAGPRQE